MSIIGTTVSLKKATIKKYARHLAALGCTFKVIEDDGTEHGTLVATAPTKGRADVIGRIDYKTALAKLAVGELIELPIPEGLTGVTVQSTVSACANAMYGAGAITSSVNRKTNRLKVLRLQ